MSAPTDAAFGKRVFDLTLVILLIAPALLLSTIAALAIMIEMRANPIFRQHRVGRGGSSFTILKLRTMRPGTPDGASHEIGQRTVTRLGRFLRAAKIDELPQLWNVLSGEMSLVGPRPCLYSQTELIEARRQRGVLSLRPGITGPAQVAGLDMSQPQRLAEADAAYLRAWSASADLAMLVRTISGAGRGDASAS